MRDYYRVETSAEVYAVIMAKHYPGLVPFETYSNPDGTCPLGNGKPEMVTAWGFKGFDYPILYTRTTWERGPKGYDRINEKHEYWLCSGTKQEEL